MPDRMPPVMDDSMASCMMFHVDRKDVTSTRTESMIVPTMLRTV